MIYYSPSELWEILHITKFISFTDLGSNSNYSPRETKPEIINTKSWIMTKESFINCLTCVMTSLRGIGQVQVSISMFQDTLLWQAQSPGVQTSFRFYANGGYLLVKQIGCFQDEENWKFGCHSKKEVKFRMYFHGGSKG